MNASNIFLLSKTLELKLESFDQQIMKIEGHLIFLQREKLAPKSKIQPSRNSVHESCLNFSKHICFKLASKWFLHLEITLKF